METTHLHTPLGLATIEGDGLGISQIRISEEQDPLVKTHPRVLEPAVRQLTEYFDGQRKEFNLQLNPRGTEFQKRVWQHLSSIPYGSTVSYMTMAKDLGDVKAIRAVAAANGKNPLWVVLPCHRVLGSDGSLTGYAGGLWRKQWLLEHEGARQQQLALNF